MGQDQEKIGGNSDEKPQAEVKPKNEGKGAASGAATQGASAPTKRAMSEQQRATWFKYHAVDADQASLIERIKAESLACQSILARCVGRSGAVTPSYDQVNDAFVKLADTINEVPLCSHSAAAIRCVLIAKMACNSIIVRTNAKDYTWPLNKANPILGVADLCDDVRVAFAHLASDNLLSAELQAVAAVAWKGI
jgi:hypothetical protein